MKNKRGFLNLALVIMATVFVLGGCLAADDKDNATAGGGGGDGGGGGGDVTFQTVYDTVFSPKCGCHDSANGTAGLSVQAAANMVNVASSNDMPYITPGDRANSRIYVRMDDGQMPPGGTDQANIDLVGTWIDGGAL